MNVLVTGGNGTLGRVLVPYLIKAGHAVRATSRRPRSDGPARWVVADLATGEGLSVAVRGIDAVIHLASATRPGRYDPQVDVAGTARLVGAAGRAGVAHLIYVSIVGIDQVPLRYYCYKLAAEEMVRSGRVPWTIRRFTQFPQLLDGVLGALSRLGPVLPVPRALIQPVDTRDVAEQLTAQLAAGPTGRISDYGGPHVLGFDEVAREWLAARGLRRSVVPVRVPGRLGRAWRSGGLVTEATPTGVRTWTDFLADTYGRQERK